MDFQEAVKTCFRKYVDFQGRSARPEFWWFMLFVFLGNTLLAALDRTLFGTASDGQPVSIAGALFGIAVFLPSLAAGVRRLHDLDRTGWWYLLLLIPVVGTMVLIFFFIQRGTAGANRFGPPPAR